MQLVLDRGLPGVARGLLSSWPRVRAGRFLRVASPRPRTLAPGYGRRFPVLLPCKTVLHAGPGTGGRFDTEDASGSTPLLARGAGGRFGAWTMMSSEKTGGAALVARIVFRGAALAR